MIGAISKCDFEAGVLDILADGIVYRANKLALFDLTFDSSLTGHRVSFRPAPRRIALDVRRYPRARDVPASPAVENIAVIKRISTAGDFCFCTVPQKQRLVFLHCSQASVGRFADSFVGRSVRFNHVQTQDGRVHLIGARLIEE